MSGAAGIFVQLKDLTTIAGGAPKGIQGWIGPTQLGKPFQPIFVANTVQYERHFGGSVPGTDFHIMAQRALKAGAQLWIVPLGVSGQDETRASATQTNTDVNETLATSTITVDTVGTDGEGLTIHVDQGSGFAPVSAEYVIQSGDTTDDVAAGLAAAVTSFAGGVTAAAAGSTVTLTAPTGSGATANGWEVNVVATTTPADAGTFTFANFSGGVTAVVAGSVQFDAKGPQSDYNGIEIHIAPAASGVAGNVDISVVRPTAPQFNESFTDIPGVVPSGEDHQRYLDKVSAGSAVVDWVTATGTIPTGTFTLAGGDTSAADFAANWDTTDYIGNQSTKTGFYAFDTLTDIFRIAAPAIADPVVDTALAAYANERKGPAAVRYWTRTPLGLTTAQSVLDYRLGEGPWSHQPIDDWKGAMYHGDLRVTDPETGNARVVHVMGDVAGNYAQKDFRQGEHYAAAGYKRGRIKNALGLDGLDLGGATQGANLDRVVRAGINPIITRNKTLVQWGARTLQRQPTAMQFDEVADLTLLLMREIPKAVDWEVFDPNAPATWRALYYQRLRPYFEQLAAAGAFNGGEGVGYEWQGDQNVDLVQNAVVNNPQEVDEGEYRARFLYKPVKAMRRLYFDLILTPTAASFGAVLEEAA